MLNKLVLWVSTAKPNLRDDIWGWSWENPNLYDGSKHIGMSPSWEKNRPTPDYRTVLEALADGWQLLGPPKEQKDPNDPDGLWYDWWMTREPY